MADQKQAELASKEEGRPPTATTAQKANERNLKDSKNVIDVVNSSVSVVQGQIS